MQTVSLKGSGVKAGSLKRVAKMRALFLAFVSVLMPALAGARDPVDLYAAADAARNNEFALALYRGLSREEAGKNLFFSPLSIRMALAMVYAGARGETAKQMNRVLGFPMQEEKLHRVMQGLVPDRNRGAGGQATFRLDVANSIWASQHTQFQKEFLNIGDTYYGAKPRTLDFGRSEHARETINRWVEEKTQDKIKDLIPHGAIDYLTRMVLANAVYFKAQWGNQFKETATKKETFFAPMGERPGVPMMQQEARGFGYFEDRSVQVLEMPYMEGIASMVVILPRDRKNGLAAMEKKLNAASLRSWMDRLEYREVKVIFPKFKTTQTLALKHRLISLGIKDAFIHGRADFSAMNGKNDLYLSAVFHQAFVDVDEKGTEAAASTAVRVTKAAYTRPEKQPPVFRADRPFLYLIRLRSSGNILFLGRLNDPTAG